ncbi:MAG: beta-lactamase family protein [Proteobacteria bacterium]|nr:beta-lactamase family protein [Pseudomonadota bacterium]
MRLLRLTVLLFAVALADAAAANVDPQHKIDQYVAGRMRQGQIPGVQVGIYRQGKVVFAKGYGVANLELGVPVRTDMVFQSGSVGKQFTATGVMLLVQEGRVGLEDSITRYFPDAPPSWQPIKVKSLLSHTSGLGQYSNHERTRPFGPFDLQHEVTEAEALARIEAMRIDFPVGERWLYCDTNYVLLGMLIHKVSGEPWGEFLAQRIFKPLGMAATRIISDAEIIPNRAAGYKLEEGVLRNQRWVAPFYNSTGDGAMYFNVLDLAKWDAALYTQTLLSQSNLERMWTPFALNNGERNIGNYGFGWFIRSIRGHRVIEHGGGWQGFTAHIARYVDDGTTVVVLTNMSSGDASEMAHAIAGLYDPALTPDADTDAPPAWLQDYDTE